MATARTVLITGCSTGIGRATATRLVERGHRVIATARRLDAIADLEGCQLLALDVTSESSIADAVAAVGTSVDVLVNNAGYSQSGAVEEVDLDDLRRQFETNVFGLVRLTQLLLPAMRDRQWGRIVNMSSMGGRMTLPGGGAYHATKYALEALSDALRYEVRPFGIDVVIIEPGPVRTNFGTTANAALPSTTGVYAAFNAGVAALVTKTYAKRPRGSTRPEAIADVVAHAVEARYPKTRYMIGATGRLLVAAHAALPDRWFDRVIATQYPRPQSPAST